ncbi:MAG: hypothetical protein V1837_08200 [Candidatus Woesearchaeota archaeon]
MRKAQIQSQLFVYIIGAILVILLVIFSFKVLGSLQKKQGEALLIGLDEKLKSAVDLGTGDFGAVSKLDLKLPDDINKVCFVDINKSEELMQGVLTSTYPEIKHSISSGERKNVFLITQNKVSHSLYSGNICLSIPYYKCVNPNEHYLRILIQGRNKCIDIIKPIRDIMIYNSLQESKYSTNPILFIKDSSSWSERQKILEYLPISMSNDKKGGIDTHPYYVYYTDALGSFDDTALSLIAAKHPGSQEYRFFGGIPISINNPMAKSEEITLNNYFSYWSKLVDVVVIDYNNQDAALISSLFASYLIAPVIFIGESNYAQYANYIDGKRVYLVDEIDSNAAMESIRTNAIEIEAYDSNYLRIDEKINPYKQLVSNIITYNP